MRNIAETQLEGQPTLLADTSLRWMELLYGLRSCQVNLREQSMMVRNIAETQLEGQPTLFADTSLRWMELLYTV